MAHSTLNASIRCWARTAGRASLTHALEVSCWAISTDRNLREWWESGVGQRLLQFKTKGYLEAMTLWSSLTGELGQGTHREVNNCPDGLFFPLHEVIILQDKNTQGWNKSCVKTETQLDCSVILVDFSSQLCLKKSQFSNKLEYTEHEKSEGLCQWLQNRPLQLVRKRGTTECRGEDKCSQFKSSEFWDLTKLPHL